MVFITPITQKTPVYCIQVSTMFNLEGLQPVEQYSIMVRTTYRISMIVTEKASLEAQVITPTMAQAYRKSSQ